MENLKEEFNKDDEINLLDYVIVLAKRKKMIISFTLAVMIITALISLMMTKIYSAKTTILPPQQGSSGLASQLLSQLGGAGALIGIPAVKTSNQLYIDLLKSNRTIDGVIDRFDLMKVYKAKSRESARRALVDSLQTVDNRKSVLIEVSVEYKDPVMAAKLANAFVEELKKVNDGLAISEASQRRLFFEERLKDEIKQLYKAEEELKEFQEKTGVLNVEEQVKTVIEAIGRLNAQIASKEVELRVMRTYSTKNNPDMKIAEEALRGLKSELNKLETKNRIEHEPLTPTKEIAGTGLEYLRKLRDVKFRQTLYELLVKQYEAAKLDESREATVIQVVDKAEPPEQRIKPKRKQMVMIAGVVGFFLSVFAAFFREYIDKSSADPENKGRIDALRGYLVEKEQNRMRLKKFVGFFSKMKLPKKKD